MFYCDDINSPEKWDWWLKVWPKLNPPFNNGNFNKPNKQGYFKIHTTISVQFQSCSNPNPEVATFHNGKSNCSGTLGRKIDTYDRCYFFCDRVNMKIYIMQALVGPCSDNLVYYIDAVSKGPLLQMLISTTECKEGMWTGRPDLGYWCNQEKPEILSKLHYSVNPGHQFMVICTLINCLIDKSIV